MFGIEGGIRCECPHTATQIHSSWESRSIDGAEQGSCELPGSNSRNKQAAVAELSPSESSSRPSSGRAANAEPAGCRASFWQLAAGTAEREPGMVPRRPRDSIMCVVSVALGLPGPSKPRPGKEGENEADRRAAVSRSADSARVLEQVRRIRLACASGLAAREAGRCWDEQMGWMVPVQLLMHGSNYH